MVLTGHARGLFVAIAACAWVAPADAQPESPGWIAVLACDHQRYQTVAEALHRDLARAGHRVRVVESIGPAAAGSSGGDSQAASFNPRLIVAVGGTSAAAAVHGVPDVPVFVVMVPNARDAVPWDDPKWRERVAGLAQSVPPARQIEWIRKTRPQCRKLAVLYSDGTRKTVNALQTAALSRGLTVVPILAKSDEFPAAMDALKAADCDGVLMLPDPRVYNSPNVQRLILWGVRRRQPVWAFSRNIVKAGAFSGIYADADTVSAEAAPWIARMMSGESAPSIGLQYPAHTHQSVNIHVSKEIGASLDAVLGPDVERLGE